MTKGLKNIAFGLVAVGLCITLLLTGAMPVCEAEPGGERTVKIGLEAIFTGFIADLGVPACCAMIDYAKYVNEQGGIDGIKIETSWYETKGSIPGTITAHRRLVGDGAIILQSGISTPLEATLSMLEKDEILNSCITALTPLLTKSEWVVTSFTDWPSMFITNMNWARKNLWTEARPMKVGTIFYDVSSGWSTLEATKYFDKIGVEFVGYEVVPTIGCIDTSTELLRLANKKVDLIYLTSYGSPSVTVVKDARRLGLQEKGIKLFASGNTLDECILRIVKKDADGWYVANITPSYFESERWPGLKTVIEVMGKYRGWKAEELRGFYVVGWVHTMVSVEAIRLAIEKVGCENLTGHAVRDAMYSIQGFETGIFPPTSMNGGLAPFITSGFGVYQVREAQFEPIDWVKAFPSLYKSPEEFERALQK